MDCKENGLIIKLKLLWAENVTKQDIGNIEPVKVLNKEGCWRIESIQDFFHNLKLY